MNLARAILVTAGIGTGCRHCVFFSTVRDAKTARYSLTQYYRGCKWQLVINLCKSEKASLGAWGLPKPCPGGFPGNCLSFSSCAKWNERRFSWPKQSLPRSGLSFTALKRASAQKRPLSPYPIAVNPKQHIKTRINPFRPGAAFAKTSSHMNTPTQCPAPRRASVTAI